MCNLIFELPFYLYVFSERIIYNINVSLKKNILLLDKSFELKSVSTDEHISQDGCYVSNNARVWDRSDSGDSSLPPYVRSPMDEYCHRAQQETKTDKSESKTFGQNKQQLTTNEISGTAEHLENVSMSSDYVPCKSLECNDQPLGLNKELKHDLLSKMNYNYHDSNVGASTNSGGYVSNSSVLNFSVN